ncbi:MAG: DUF1398 family protein [Burkholderiales bacterium]|nr:DUF1398 family protein [Burkholderiales bacterium]
MNAENSVREIVQRSNQGRMHFGEVVTALSAAGVESYQVDFRAANNTYYFADDTALALPQKALETAIAEQFDASALVDAIRAAQRGEVMYPEFKRLSLAAGCVGYMVWITGRHVSYLGRRGETHVERFPD